jgi:hypothetical protein
MSQCESRAIRTQARIWAADFTEGNDLQWVTMRSYLYKRDVSGIYRPYNNLQSYTWGGWFGDAYTDYGQPVQGWYEYHSQGWVYIGGYAQRPGFINLPRGSWKIRVNFIWDRTAFGSPAGSAFLWASGACNVY